MASTDSNTIVQGQVRFYNAEKKFGFVEVSGQRVFFHLSACREVDGTPEEPEFSNRPSDKAPSWWRGMRYPEEIILRVVAGHKGPMAAVWGYRPKRNWLESLQYFGRLNDYPGGCITLQWSKREYGRVHRTVDGRLQTTPTLEPTGGPEDPWRLTLEYDVYDGMCGVYSPPTRRETTVVMLERWGDHTDAKHTRGIGIVHRDIQRDEWLYISIGASTGWFGWKPGDD